MNNKHDANVRKSTLVNFQLGLIVALLCTVLVMEIKTAIPLYDKEFASIDEPLVETYFNPDYVIEREIEEPIKDKAVSKQIIDKIDVVDDAELKDTFEDVVLTTTPEPTIVKPGTIIEKPIEEDPIPVDFKKVESVPIFPGCEGLTTNEERRDCMSSKINKIVQKKFDTNLAEDLGLTGRQRINLRFSIDKNGMVTNIQGRSTHPKLTQEGKRMISYIPDMTPGKQSNKPVEVFFDLPIVFDVKD